MAIFLFQKTVRIPIVTPLKSTAEPGDHSEVSLSAFDNFKPQASLAVIFFHMKMLTIKFY